MRLCKVEGFVFAWDGRRCYEVVRLESGKYARTGASYDSETGTYEGPERARHATMAAYGLMSVIPPNMALQII